MNSVADKQVHSQSARGVGGGCYHRSGAQMTRHFLGQPVSAAHMARDQANAEAACIVHADHRRVNLFTLQG